MNAKVLFKIVPYSSGDYFQMSEIGFVFGLNHSWFFGKIV